MADEPTSAAGSGAPVQQAKPEAPPMQRLTRMAPDGVSLSLLTNSVDLTKTVQTAAPEKKT